MRRHSLAAASAPAVGISVETIMMRIVPKVKPCHRRENQHEVDVADHVRGNQHDRVSEARVVAFEAESHVYAHARRKRPHGELSSLEAVNLCQVW
jgi:hypothetical protein